MFLELLAITAFAQDSTTNCRPDASGQVVCTTRERRDGPNMACAGGDWWLVGCSAGAHREAREARDAQQRSAGARERAMTLLQANDCAGAQREALGSGDLNFAREVRAYCAAGK